MKKIIFLVIPVLLLAACKKESGPVTKPLTNALQSNPILKLTASAWSRVGSHVL